MSNGFRTSILFGLTCLCYLLTAPSLPTEISAVFKIIPILFLCQLSLKAGTDSYGSHLLAALLFSMGGDVLLEIGFFVPGLVSFLFAQLLYGSLFLRCHSDWRNRPAVSLAIVGFSIAMGILMWGYAGEMRIPVLVYLVVIAVMGLSANTSHITGATIGAAIFIFSDTLIAVNRFVLPIPASEWLIMVSYYLAQFCLVSSVVKHKTSARRVPTAAD